MKTKIRNLKKKRRENIQGLGLFDSNDKIVESDDNLKILSDSLEKLKIKKPKKQNKNKKYIII